MAIAIVVATVVIVGIVVGVLARQGSVGRLSEEHGTGGRRPRGTGRPAGPDAESMSTDTPGQPVTPPPTPEDPRR